MSDGAVPRFAARFLTSIAVFQVPHASQVAATIGGVNVQWEGIYGASIRPVGNTGKWYVGTVNLSSTCDGACHLFTVTDAEVSVQRSSRAFFV